MNVVKLPTGIRFRWKTAIFRVLIIFDVEQIRNLYTPDQEKFEKRAIALTIP
jgi:hypothetical protein